MKALLIIDVQNDFMPGGNLAVPHAYQIIPNINQLSYQFDLVVATQDWHPPDHKSFVENHPGKQLYEQIMLNGLKQTLWPAHCVQGTWGANFHDLLDIRPIEAIFRKGTHSDIDSYSGFYDNGHQKPTGLAGYLREKQVDELYFCGLCADICVYYSIKDARSEGFNCFLIEKASCALDQTQYQQIKKELLGKEVTILS